MRLELFGDEIESIRSFDPMSQGSRRRLTSVDLLPASEFLPADGWAGIGGRAPSLPSDQLREDVARLEQGDLGEAAETWAALLTAGPAADHVPDRSHLVLTDHDELSRPCPRARCARPPTAMPASWRPARFPTRGRLRTTRPSPSPPWWLAPTNGSRRETPRMPAMALRRRCRAGPSAPGRGSLELAAGGRRVVVTTDQASRVGELLEEAGHPAASVAELRELPQPGTHRTRARIAVGRAEPRAQRAAAAHRSGAVRRHPRPAADQWQARRHPRPDRQAAARRPRRSRRPRHRALRRDDAAHLRRAT